MARRWVSASLVLILLIYAFAAVSVYAQDEHDEAIKLNLHRRVGFGLAGFMQGTFSIDADAPADVIQVDFYLDGRKIGEDSQPPFNLQFNTGDYDTGGHSFSAVGHGEPGQEYGSKPIRRQFIGLGSSILIAGIIILLAVGVRLAAGFISSRGSGTGSEATSGIKGDTVCPNCGKPFAIHWWSPKILGVRIDRCPHCRKWNRARPAAPADLQMARALLVESADEDLPPTGRVDTEQKRRILIEESKYDDR